MEKLTDYQGLKQYLPIISHWSSKGKVRFIPVGILLKRAQIDSMFGYKEGDIPLSFIWWSTNKAKDKVKLEIVCVNQNFLGLGFGTGMMEFMEEENPEAKLFTLKVIRNNSDARLFYRNLGFEEVSMNDDHTMIIMEKYKKIENN